MANVRVPEDRVGDLEAQIQATAVGEARLRELIARYGRDVVLAAFAECQEYVERLARAQLARLPHGSWVTEDYIDRDPDRGDGMIPVRVRLTLSEDGIAYDLSGSAPAIGSFHNAARGGAFSALVAGTKMFFPELPLNSGFFRVLSAELPVGSVVNAQPPSAVTGFTSGAFEKIIHSVCELWSEVVPERAIACSFNLEYMLVGGRDLRDGEPREFIWHDWNAGGWGGRSDRDGFAAGPSYFGAGSEDPAVRGAGASLPGADPLPPAAPGFGRARPVPRRGRGGEGDRADRRRGHGRLVLLRPRARRRRGLAGRAARLPARRSTQPGYRPGAVPGGVLRRRAEVPGDVLSRPASGGGGIGDPLLRDPDAVREDVLDGYVSVRRAARDYGVAFERVDLVALEAVVDAGATVALRAEIAAARDGRLLEEPVRVAAWLRDGEIDLLDVVRRYGVVIDRHTGEALPRSTEQLRAAMARRRSSVPVV